MLAVLNFLDNREKAVVVWVFLLLVFVWHKDRGIGGSLLAVLRAMFAPKLLLTWVAAATYAAALVFAAHAAGFWHTTAIKETVYWFVGTAAVLTAGAMTVRDFGHDYAKRVARSAVRATLIIELLVSLYPMPLLAELVLVPVVGSLVVMQAVAEKDSQASVRKPLDRTLMLAGLALMTWVAVSALTDLHGLLTREHAERLLLVPAFTIAFAPFLYATWRWSRWDQERVMRRWREQELAA